MNVMKKMSKHKKNDLRLKLQEQMGQSVRPMEFARWLRYYCDLHHLPDEINRAKTLDTSLADEFGTWLGYPLR